MEIDQQNLTVEMIRENLDEIPPSTLPENYSLRCYQPGDEQFWLEIQKAAERYRPITTNFFTDTFGCDSTLLSQRQLYIFDPRGNAIGTGTAWFDDNFRGKKWGRVHWLAIRPEFQGQGLSKPLLGAVCHRLKELGHQSIYLRTSTGRIPAIHLYLRFGFRPLLTTPEDREIWQELRSKLIRPA